MNPLAPAGPALELGVNIDHVATLRNARGTVYPDPVVAARIAEEAGADAITLHLREDRRHIRDADVDAIRASLITRMNLECALSAEMLAIACRVRPHDVCLVPEKRQEVTTEGGLEIAAQRARVADACAQLREAGSRVSLFIDADPAQIDAAAEIGAPVIEIHTGRYADAEDETARANELRRIVDGVARAESLGLRVNAGHGLHYANVQPIAALPGIRELNIGHALIGHAVFVGLANAVREMKAIMTAARFGALHGTAEGQRLAATPNAVDHAPR